MMTDPKNQTDRPGKKAIPRAWHWISHLGYRDFSLLFLVVSINMLAGCGKESWSKQQDKDQTNLQDAIDLSQHYADSNAKKSEDFANEAIELSRRTMDTAHYCEASLLLAVAYFKQNKMVEAVQTINSILPVARRHGLTKEVFRAYNLAGILKLKQADLRSALDYYDSAFLLINNLPWGKGEDKQLFEKVVSVMSGIGSNSIRLGQHRSAIRKLLTATTSNSDELRMYAMGHIAELYRVSGSYDTAMQFIDQAGNIAKRLDRQTYLIKMYGLKANVFFNLGIYDSCLLYNQKVENIALDSKEGFNDLPYIYNNMATVYHKKSNLPMAIYYFTKSLDMKEKSHDSAGMAITFSNLGIIYKNSNNYLKAREYYQNSLQINFALKNQAGIGKGFVNLGDLFFAEECYDSALVYFRKALDIYQKLNDSYGRVIALDGLGRTCQNISACRHKSMAYFREAESLANIINAGYWVASLNYEIGEQARQSGNYLMAEERLKKSIKHAKMEPWFDILQDASRSLLETKFYTSGHEDYSKLFNEYILTTDSIRKREQDELTAEMLVRYDMEKRDKENQLLQQKVSYQQLMLKSRTTQLIGTMILVLLLFIFGTTIYWQYRKRTLAYQIIVKQNVAAVRDESIPGTEYLLLKNLPITTFNAMTLSDKYLVTSLFNLMGSEKPFLNPDLTLDDLCKKLNTNRTYLSNIINSSLGKNYNTYINEYRVAEARRILAGIKGNLYSVEEVGRMSGFKTKSSFHSSFKTFIGVTPAYFRDHVLNS